MMPIQISEGKTPAGKRLMRCQVSGHVSQADAEGMHKQLQPGQPYNKCLVLCVVEKNTDYSPESRRLFKAMIGSYKAMGTVVGSAILRAAINFMQRVMGATDFRMFNGEAEALAWLDEQDKLR
jgi:hypothetical protein